jgi:predicted transcriptional regulator
MKRSTLTIQFDAKVRRELDRLCRQLGRSPSDIVRNAFHRQVAVFPFEQSRRALLPHAEAQGILTDENVFRVVS